MASRSSYSSVAKAFAGDLDLSKIVFSHSALMGNSDASYVVTIFNGFFNNGKPESTGCYPCVRRATEYIRKLIVLDAPIVFDTEDVMKVYTIYDHPTDHPGDYVIRCWLTGKDYPQPTAMSGYYYKSPILQKCIDEMNKLGLVPIARNEGDDPVILKSYI